MHRNHAYIRAQISKVEEQLKVVFHHSAACSDDAEGHFLSLLVHEAIISLECCRTAARDPARFDSSGKQIKQPTLK
jgi:hypothetical protein